MDNCYSIVVGTCKWYLSVGGPDADNLDTKLIANYRLGHAIGI